LDAIHIVIYKDWGERLEVLNPVAVKKDVLQWSWIEYDEGDIPSPTFILPRVLDRLSTTGIAQQLVDGFAELGILPDRVREQETLMELKHAHLEDMRHLVFGMDWLNIQKGVPVELESERDATMGFRVPDAAQDREVSEDE
jgi:hypothetical protein